MFAVATMTIGERLRAYRLGRKPKMSLRGLAGYMGVSHSQLSQWERNLTQPTRTQCEKIAAYTGWDVEEVWRVARGNLDAGALPAVQDWPPAWLTNAFRTFVGPERRAVEEISKTLLELREVRAGYEATPPESSTPPSPPPAQDAEDPGQ